MSIIPKNEAIRKAVKWISDQRRENPDLSLMDGKQPFILETREGATDRFQFEAEIAADFVPRHAQVELGRRVASRLEALRKIEQESRQAFLGAHRAKQHHYAVITNDLSTHHLVEVMLQGMNLPRQAL